MTEEVVVVGAGGFGRETLDVLAAMTERTDRQVKVLGVLDDSPTETNVDRLRPFGVPYLGRCADWLGTATPMSYVVGVGAPGARRRISTTFESAGHRPVTAVHPDVTVGTGSVIGPGSVLCAGAQVSSNVRIGAHVHINPNATIGHDAVLSDFVSINPAATISGDCYLDAGTLVGAGAVVLQGLTVGAGAVVGAAACVIRDVAPGTVVKGVPAR